MRKLFYSFLAVAGFVGASADARAEFAKLETNRIHYVVEGKGKHDIVLVHCWAGNLTFWKEQLPALKDKARVISIDLPGHGLSDKPHREYSMDYFAEAVLAVMKDAKSEKATLIGHSMGAPVICRVYKQAPEKVAGLVSVDGTLRRPKMSPEQAERFVGNFRGTNYVENCRKFMASMFPIAGTEKVRDWATDEILKTPQYVMVGAMEGMFKPDQPDWDVGRVEVPVFAINTTNKMWTADYEKYVLGLSEKSLYATVDGAGHWMMLEKPKDFNEELVLRLEKFGLIDK